MINENLKNKVVEADYKVIDDPANTSPHCPLLLKLVLNSQTKMKHQNVNRRHVPKPILSKCDHELYESRMKECLEKDVNPTCPELAVNHLINSIKLVEKEAIPFTKPKVRDKPWNPQIKNLLSASRKADAKWKEAKEGQMNNKLIDELFNVRKKAKHSLRQAQ